MGFDLVILHQQNILMVHLGLEYLLLQKFQFQLQLLRHLQSFQKYPLRQLLHRRLFVEILLHPDCRDILAVWTPFGLIRPTRLPFGTINAGTILQNFLTAALTDLPPEVRARLCNYADDVCGGARDEDELFVITKAFFEWCRKYGITLKPSKTPSIGRGGTAF